MRRPQEAVQWPREAAKTGFPCYPLFACDVNLGSVCAGTRQPDEKRWIGFTHCSIRRRLAGLLTDEAGLGSFFQGGCLGVALHSAQ